MNTTGPDTPASPATHAVHVCAACGYTWNPRVPNPVMCPQCHTSKWRGTGGDGRAAAAAPASAVRRFSCTRCGHEWTPRGNGSPKVCPACNTVFWNRPRERNYPERLRARQRKAVAPAASTQTRQPGETVRVRAVCAQCGGEVEVEVRLLTCAKCGKSWIQSGVVPPVRCPSCGQKHWAEGWARPPAAGLSFSPGVNASQDGGSLVLRP